MIVAPRNRGRAAGRAREATRPPGAPPYAVYEAFAIITSGATPAVIARRYGHEPAREHRCAGVDRHRLVVGRHRREPEPGEVLERRGDASVEQARREGRAPFAARAGTVEKPRRCAAMNEPATPGHVRDRSEVDVDAEALERGRRLAAAPADRAPR